ncbi:mRNA capping enzyme, large subunit, partial [Terfezia boudieri ATCC MYA-4762]
RRPGAASRLTDSEREAARVLQEKRDAEEAARKKAESDPSALAVEDVVRSHYNERPEMGKVWRVESSRIKGLRALNNWIKSCIIHKFSPSPGVVGGMGGARYGGVEDERLYVLDVGCGKGGDLRKWKLAPQEVGMYVGVDNAEVSIAQARDRYESMLYENRPPPRGGYNRRPPPRGPPLFRAEFTVRDCWVDSFIDVPCIREIGFDASVTPAGIRGGAGRWATGGGFDVVSMMFCLHYAFESEAKARRMLANVSGALKKGGRFVGTIPSSDVIKEKLGGWVKEQEEKQQKEHEVSAEKSTLARIIPPCSQPPSAPAPPPQPAQQPTTTPTPHRGSSSPPYVPGGLAPTIATPPKHTWDNRFRPPFGWRYQYHLDEAVEGVPEYIVPWESFRALCEEFNLELVYKRGFHDIWREESRGGELGRLSERMGVREGREGGLELTEEEWEACGFYVAFAFRKS